MFWAALCPQDYGKKLEAIWSNLLPGRHQWLESEASHFGRRDNSVRGAQYKYCIGKNSKIPKYSFHKLPFESFRIWPLALWPLQFNFEILVFLVNFWPLSHLLHTVHVLFLFHDFFTTNSDLVLASQLLPRQPINLFDMIHQSSE